MIVPMPTAKKRARIEIIPLIDIIFFLLATFVMISLSMVKNQGISVNLPTAVTSSAQEVDRIITITLSGQQEIYIDKDLVSFDQMSARLKELKSADPNLKVLINGDEKASFGRAINVLDEIRRIGIVKVSIRTKLQANGS
jgi:biopolymer transport protein ExbD